MICAQEEASADASSSTDLAERTVPGTALAENHGVGRAAAGPTDSMEASLLADVHGVQRARADACENKRA